MSEDGHKYFFGQMPEMPYKRKEREMDKEFKIIVLKLILKIYRQIAISNSAWAELKEIQDEINEYVRRLG